MKQAKIQIAEWLVLGAQHTSAGVARYVHLRSSLYTMATPAVEITANKGQAPTTCAYPNTTTGHKSNRHRT